MKNLHVNARIFILIVITTLTCGQRKDTRNNMKPLPCNQGVWKRKGNGTELSCYHQSQQHQYEREYGTIHFKGNEYLHLTSFSINDEQYQLFTDKQKVILTKWSEDDQRLQEVQKLRIDNAYSAGVIFYAGNAILMVAVYNISDGCQFCNIHDNKNPSRAFLWDHSAKKFEKNHIQNLPSARFIHAYPEQYRNRSTVICIFTKCDCNTKIYYLEKNNSNTVFSEIDQGTSLLFRETMVVQSVRYRGTQYVLFAPLNRSNKNESIRIFKWTQCSGSLTFHRNLSTYINEDTGLSTAVFQNDVFLCSVSEASKNVTLYRLTPDKGHLEEMTRKEGEVEFSMCNFFVHPRDHELYVAVGLQCRVELLKYSLAAQNFMEAGILPEAENTLDLICFQSMDDTHIVTTGECKRKRKRNKTYCRKNVYRRIDSLSSEPYS